MDVKVIPFTKGYLASKDGTIYDPHGVVRNQYTNGDGYKTACVLTDHGQWRTFGVHRLVALAHIPVPHHVPLVDLTVNHKDKDVCHNHVSNLEWITVKKNNSHAVLMRGSKYRPVILAKRPDGQHEFIANLQEAAKKFSCDIDLVWEAIRDHRDINGWLLVHYTTKTKIPDELRLDNFPGGRGKGALEKRSVDIKDIKTKEVESFDSLHDAAIRHGVAPSHIYQAISKDGNKRLFKKRYLIVSRGDVFPEISKEEYEELLAPTGKNVLAYNVRLNRYETYESASQFIKLSGLSKKAVSVDLKKNCFRQQKDWFYTYLSEENSVRLRALVDGPNFH